MASQQIARDVRKMMVAGNLAARSIAVASSQETELHRPDRLAS
jgi:hypothetical protein